ncbi:MAG TPA: DUF4911 domain-containing protein [Syntrophomonas sp.]|nr:DUF4911 domain-containing protein [Syntrophomonas sp.]
MRDQIYVRLQPAKIDMLTKLVEAYDHLGVVSTLDQSEGLVVIRSTADCMPELEEILRSLPFSIEICAAPPQ